MKRLIVCSNTTSIPNTTPFMNPSTAFTCLLFILLQLPLSAYSPATPEIDPGKSMRVLSDLFSESFMVESFEQALQLNVYTLGGSPVPVTIYRHHHYGTVLYEVGQELPKGLYLIKLSHEDFSVFYKLMKMNH